MARINQEYTVAAILEENGSKVRLQGLAAEAIADDLRKPPNWREA